MGLAADAAPTVLLHGDLTPVNILDGGAERGLVAIDPAPRLGDPAFDAVDLVLWPAASVDTIVERAEQLAPAIGSRRRSPAGLVRRLRRHGRAGDRRGARRLHEQVEPLLALASGA